jgi:hypothetical protein
MTASKPPPGLGAGGARLWAAITDGYELGDHEAAILVEAARTVDLLADLHAEVRRAGPMVDEARGRDVSRAVVEIRAQRLTLARLVTSLRIPDDQVAGRPQRRSFRGTYGVPGA